MAWMWTFLKVIAFAIFSLILGMAGYFFRVRLGALEDSGGLGLCQGRQLKLDGSVCKLLADSAQRTLALGKLMLVPSARPTTAMVHVKSLVHSSIATGLAQARHFLGRPCQKQPCFIVPRAMPM